MLEPIDEPMLEPIDESMMADPMVEPSSKELASPLQM